MKKMSCGSDLTKLYVPFCKEGNGHWLALEIDLSQRCIYVYDSETSVMRRAQLERQLEPIRVVVPMLLTKLNANYSAEKFDWKRLTSPSQSNGDGDHGTYLESRDLKYSSKSMDVSRWDIE
ncbi:deubiquitinase and deneddylase Dub2 [Striga asiatica]|uniref:Deubiquitinase and deneddylase Dub2 n=1 Tax=Striga asiatica TaxID=4170 RepID=A0A5A7R429_STRAF|nr:deubiquitinase and deneddylase Dub2 [Striga asiatica]